MQPKRPCWWLILSALVCVALAGCAPRAGQGLTATQEGADRLAADLPALVIDVDAKGNFAIGGIPLAALAASLGASGLETLKLTPEQATMLTNANIQHLQISNLPTGLDLLVNGQQIPTLVWDGESLAALQTLAGQLGAAAPPIIQQLLPTLAQLGVGVTVRFPLAQGAELIGLTVSPTATVASGAEQAFLDSVGAAPRIVLPVHYAADGSWQLNGLTDAEWIALTGQSALESLRLPADLITDLAAARVREIVITSDPVGLHVRVNDVALPYLAWGEGRLSHALQLAAGAGLLGDLGGENTDGLAATIEALLPLVTGSEIELRLLLPEAGS